MVLIAGEILDDKISLCFLECFSDRWTGHGLSFIVSKWEPKFVTITSNSSYFKFKFCSDKGQVRCGKIKKIPETVRVISCNNRHTITPCHGWDKVKEKKSDILFHLGDQIYADRIYWRWWRYLTNIKKENWDLYKADIQMEYYREYWETWYPIRKILANVSNIMIPDDHEIRDQASMWNYFIGGACAETLSINSVKEIYSGCVYVEPETKKTQLEKFLSKVAWEACFKLYLGLRLTNREHFDYFRNIAGVSIILAERITHPFLHKNFLQALNKFKPQIGDKLIFMGGLPPCPIRPNFWEYFLYRHGPDVPDEDYEKLWSWLFSLKNTKKILVGGDLHSGTVGWILDKKNKKNKMKFHVASPISGFPSAYMPEDVFGPTKNYDVKVTDYRSSDPNSVLIDLKNLRSTHEFTKAGWSACWQNAASTGYTFWSY